jgi:hypothetical protein
VFFRLRKSDVLWHGKKIAGAAQRRNKLGLLIQGSVQPPPISLSPPDWQKAMCDVGALNLGLSGRILRRTRRCGTRGNISWPEEIFANGIYNRKR